MSESRAGGSRLVTSAGTRPLRIEGRDEVAQDVIALTLADPAGAALSAWSPGAHVDVLVRPGLVRQYSLCGDHSDPARWRIAVLREDASRGGSIHLHDHARPGSVLQVGAPRNNFPLVDAERYLLIAGGIGITPLLPMARELRSRGANWRLVYGGRHRSRMAFLDELGGYPQVEIVPQDVHGPLPVAQLLADPAATTAVYCCGPEGLLRAVETACANRPAGTLHVERFHADPDLATAPDEPFEVQLASTGQVLEVAAGQSILDALHSAGLDVPSSCREGTCASCETGVLDVVDGEIEHRDAVLTDAERLRGDTMMLCVSRTRSGRLVLDM